MYALIFANAMLFLSTLSLRRATFGLGTPSILPQFLSTLSLRRATCPCQRRACRLSHFYPRSPCGERRILVFCGPQGSGISIHALLAESDPEESGQRHSPGISIHALLAESDLGNVEAELHMSKFLSTLSLRRATLAAYWVLSPQIFLSTLSLRRATGQGTCAHYA